MPSRSCCLCSKKSPIVSLHSFPKDGQGMNTWKEICAYEVTDNVSSLFVCSNHFTEDDYVSPNAKMFGGRLKLKPGRFPSIDVPNKTTNFIFEQVLCNTFDESTPFSEDTEIVPIANKVCEPMSSTSSTCLKSPKQQDDVVMQTPKKRKFHEPCFVNEIATPHLSTPRIAKRTMNLALNRVKHLEMKNNSLRQRCKRLMKKVTSMEEKLKHLQKNNSLSEDAAETIIVVKF